MIKIKVGWGAVGWGECWRGLGGVERERERLVYILQESLKDEATGQNQLANLSRITRQ